MVGGEVGCGNVAIVVSTDDEGDGPSVDGGIVGTTQLGRVVGVGVGGHSPGVAAGIVGGPEEGTGSVASVVDSPVVGVIPAPIVVTVTGQTVVVVTTAVDVDPARVVDVEVAAPLVVVGAQPPTTRRLSTCARMAGSVCIDRTSYKASHRSACGSAGSSAPAGDMRSASGNSNTPAARARRLRTDHRPLMSTGIFWSGTMVSKRRGGLDQPDSQPIPSSSEPSKRCGSGGRAVNLRNGMSGQSRSGGDGGMHTVG